LIGIIASGVPVLKSVSQAIKFPSYPCSGLRLLLDKYGMQQRNKESPFLLYVKSRLSYDMFSPALLLHSTFIVSRTRDGRSR